MLKKSYFFLSLFLFNLISCQHDDSVQPTNVTPVLKNLVVPDTIFTQIGQPAIVSVQVIDDNGWDDIKSVNYQIFNSVGANYAEGNLVDDGDYENHGDIIAKNGIFSQRLPHDFPTGSYRFVVSAVDRSELESDSLDKTFFAKLGILNHAPTLSALQIPDSVYVDGIISFILQVRASDGDEGDFVQKVICQIFGPTISDLAQEGELTDDGLSGDQFANDGIFTLETTTAFAYWKFGSYYLFITAFDSRQKISESYIKVLPWAKINLGVVPYIFNLSAPDTIIRPSSGGKSFLLTLEASDADNNRDIKEVFFYSKRPDGEYANSGNPFQLYDDGQSGDEIADDYKYSLTIWITSENTIGNYTFEFQARDYSNLLSNKIIHIITVTN